MKAPFPSWLPYFVMIALCCAFALYVEFGRTGLMRFPLAPNAVVRSLRGDEPVTATVVLDSGSVADAEVAPGCFVQVGDRVFVRDSSDDAEPRRLLVFSSNMGVHP